jgi:hypothetical protein
MPSFLLGLRTFFIGLGGGRADGCLFLAVVTLLARAAAARRARTVLRRLLQPLQRRVVDLP